MHSNLVNLFNQLGYEKTPGLCHGLAVRWIEACLLNEEHFFLARLEAVLARGVALKNDFTRAKAKKGKNLTAEDLACFEVMGFFDSLALFQNPSGCAIFRGQRTDQGNVDGFSSVASSNKMRELGGLASVYSASNLYYLEEIKSYFDMIANLIDVLDIPADETIGFLLSSVSHSIAVTYSKVRGWSFMDSNQYPPKSVSTDELPQLLAEAFFLPIEENRLVFTTQVITTQKNPKLVLLKDTLNQLDQRHLLTAEKLVDKSYSLSLLTLLVKNNEAQKFRQLMQFYPDLSQLTTDSVALVYIAAEYGQVDILVELAKHGAELNQPSFGGAIPMYIAAFNGHRAIVAELVKYGAEPNKPSYNEETPLYVAVINGDAAMVAELAKHGVDLNQLLVGDPSIFIAATLGHEELVRELIRHQVDIDQSSSEGATPLFIAVQEGHRSIVELLLKQKANLNLYLTKSAGRLSCFTSWNGDEKVAIRMNNFIMQQVLKETPENKNGWFYKFFRWLINSFNDMPEDGSTWYFNLLKSITIFLFYCVYGDTPIQISPYDIALIMGHNDIAELLSPSPEQIKISSSSESFFSVSQNVFTFLSQEQVEWVDKGASSIQSN
ncbi:ankyrin repeat domain-containing protein [Legionella lytica]|uniref:Ankyrin repeat domain-containing protein n=1 Tax=Legionella lytica TaxID=96232 RepID=A0ABW8D4U1_9GAMM